MSDGLNWFIELAGASAVALPTSEESPADTARRPGDRIAGRFELLERLGKGGMGVVYHARELASGRSVAIKLLNGTITPTQRERFRREGIVTASLQHPGIVSIHGAGALHGTPYLVYEYVPGGRTLRDLMGDAPRTELLTLLRDAAEALGVAHEAGVVHRDVKPGNLLVDSQGRVRVADFGLVRAPGLESLTKTGEMLGTPLYMPQEQFDHDGTLGPPADVWSLGVILHEVLTGAPPFEFSGLVELIGAIQHTPIDPHRHDPTLDPGLVAICKRALRQAPGDRYPDAAAFADDLTRVLDGEEPLTLRQARRRKASVLAGVLLGLLAAVVAVFLARVPPAGPLARTLAEVEAGRASAAALASALAANPEAPPALRATARLRLSAGPGADRATWERRLEHARRAAELDPTRAAEAHGLAGRAALELGQYDEAARLLKRARGLGREPALQLEDAALLAGCAQWRHAQAALTDLRAAAEVDRRAERLALEVAIAQGGGREALAGKQSELTRSESVVVESLLANAAGGDPLTPLRTRAAEHPGDAVIAAALVRLHLARGELAEAQQALERATASGYTAPAGLARAINALVGRETGPAKRLGRPWKLAVGRGLAQLARRELDLARQRDDPRYESGTGALPASRRRARAQRYLAFLQDELATERLEAKPRPPSSALARVQRQIQKRQHVQALAAFAEHVARRDYDLGSYEELQATATALAKAYPQARKRLHTLTSIGPPRELPTATPGAEVDLPDALPYDWSSLYQRAALNLRSDPGRALTAMVLAVSRAPRLLRNLRNDLFRFTRANELVGSQVTLATLATTVTGSGWLDRLARATLAAVSCEWEGAPPTTHELDRVLADHPGVIFARVLRLRVLTKAGRLLAAREDLAIVREEFPDDLPSTASIRLFLLAKAKAPPEQVLRALRRARAKGFRVKELWRGDELEELGPYMQHDEIRALLERKPKHRR